MSPAEQVTNWQRTSPIAIVFFITRFLRRIVVDGLPALAPVLAWFAATDGSQRAWIITGLIALLSFLAVIAVLSYLRFRFRIDEKRVLIRRGILHREQLTIDFNRIQNVTIKEPIYARPFGVALLDIDTAGSGGQEVTLGGIAKPIALGLREAIFAGERPPPEDDAEQPVEGEVASGNGDERLLLTRDRNDIARYGLTANGLLWIAVVVGALASSIDWDDWEGSEWIAGIGWLNNWFETAKATFSSEFWAGVIIFGVIVLIAILLPLFSILGAFFRYYGYRLTVSDDTYRRQSGLLNKHEESLKQHKIQLAIWRQNFMGRLVKRINLQLRVASAQSLEQAAANPQAVRKPFIVPALRNDEAARMVEEFLPECRIGDVGFSGVHRRYIAKNLVFGWTLPLLGPTIGLSFAFGLPGLLVLPLGYGFGYLILRQIWKRLGYGVAGEYGFARSGFLGINVTIFSLFKVQRVDITQTPGQRASRLANLTLHLASHSATIPYMPLDDAEHFRDLVLYHIETSKKAWY